VRHGTVPRIAAHDLRQTVACAIVWRRGKLKIPEGAQAFLPIAKVGFATEKKDAHPSVRKAGVLCGFDSQSD